MSAPFGQFAFSQGEVSPALFGRFDTQRIHVASSTQRNMYVNFRGGAYSRAGTAIVGFSKQTGRSYPPRLITFQFNINQGLGLEFGNNYMRVIENGAFVTEGPVAITGITQANPGVISAAATGVVSAVSIATGVTATYAPGDLITLAGGTFSTAAVLAVTNTQLSGLTLFTAGTGVYAPGDTVTLTGGTQSTPAQLTVDTTQVVSATISAGGIGGTDGTATVTGTTGTGTFFTALVTIVGGTIVAVNSVTTGGNYTVNPTVPAVEPVTGGALVGAALDIKIGIRTFTITTPGVFTANPSTGSFTQNTTSGSGTGATFNFAIMGPNAVTVPTGGVYQSTPANPVAQASTTGTGLGATFTATYGAVLPFNDGDWVFLTAIQGMTQLNGVTGIVANSTTANFSLTDVYGTPIDTTGFSAYITGGTAARLYTLPTIYSEVDLPYLKWAQSADVMTLCCVNQQTLTEYPAQNLSRVATNTGFAFSQIVAAPSIGPPSTCTASASSGGSTNYQYVVTALDPRTRTESIASPIATVQNAVNIAATAGTITVTWDPVAGVSTYYVYKASPTFGSIPPVGARFGFAGIAFGTQFADSNIVQDFSQVPVLAKDPFARGQILSVTATAGGSGYTTATATVNSSTGSGAVVVPIIVNGVITAYSVQNGGRNYALTDTVTITGNGVNATASVQVGPQTGTYPATVAYDQQRRAYGYTLNNPDTYFFSQPGAFNNFDSREPTVASDAIIGSPWATQVNGIQWMVPMPGGLVVLTGKQAWQLTGTGGSSLNPQPITPTTQQAQPQAYNGVDEKVPPIPIDSDIIYVQAKGSIYRDFAYQYYLNIYTGNDLTVNSGQLFTGFQTVEHAWCEEPNKVLWSVRNDGAMLSLTYLKSEKIAGWARHDTNGLFNSVTSVTEPSLSGLSETVDALYTAVQRFPGSHTAYMIERMDDRLWTSVEDTWCVDSGLALPQPEPSASLSISSSTGLGSLTGVTSLVGGTGYSAGTTLTVVDDNGGGPGTGAVATPTIAAGVITNVVFSPAGTGYVRPQLVVYDPAGSEGGSGFSADVILNDSATLTASGNVFLTQSIGSVVRAAGGRATITAVPGPTQATVTITLPFTGVLPNSGGFIPPQAAGTWTMTAPVSTVTGLNHLIGATVTGVADGEVIAPQVVSALGTITLAVPASAVIVGLGFTAQLQSCYLDPQGGVTQQGQRKKIAAVTARIEASGPFEIGTNQPDASVQSPPVLVAEWANLTAGPTHGVPPYGSTTVPLFTGDCRFTTPGGFDTKGQVAIQQSQPQPLNVLAFISEEDEGDKPQTKVPPQGGRATRAGSQ